MPRARLSPCLIWREKEFKHHKGSSDNPIRNGNVNGLCCNSAIEAVRQSISCFEGANGRSVQRYPPKDNPMCCVIVPETGEQCKIPSYLGAHCVRHNTSARFQRCYVLPVCRAHHPTNTNLQHFSFTCAQNTVGCLDREQDFDEYSRRRATTQQVPPEKQALFEISQSLQQDDVLVDTNKLLDAPQRQDHKIQNP
ncbi:hypothetical protein WJX79_003193 [Trebouxia sp. C0005]